MKSGDKIITKDYDNDKIIIEEIVGTFTSGEFKDHHNAKIKLKGGIMTRKIYEGDLSEKRSRRIHA